MSSFIVLNRWYLVLLWALSLVAAVLMGRWLP